MDNLPKDPTSDSDNPSPPFGSNFNPHSDPPDHVVDPVQSWVAQHQKRDEHGHFVKSDHLTSTQASPASHASDSVARLPETGTVGQAGGSNIPSPVSFTQNNKYSEKNDPPLVAVSVTNPITYLKLFIKRLLKNEGIDIRLKIKPLTVIAIITGLSLSFGTGFNVARMFFPNSSPIFHRSITLQGEVQRSESGLYYLTLPDNTLWTLRPKTINIDLINVVNRQVLVKGNMTAEANVVEVIEVIVFDKFTPRSSSSEVGPKPVMYTAPAIKPATNSAIQSNP